MKNELKRILWLLGVCLLTLSMIPGGVFAETIQADLQTNTAPAIEGKIDLPELNNEGVVRPEALANAVVQTQLISGDYYYLDIDGGVAIAGYSGHAAEVVIPDTLDGKKVVEISSYCFYGDDSTSFIVSNNVKTIKANAFSGYLMNKIVIPETTTVIEANAFPATLFTTLKIYGKKGSAAETFTSTISNARFVDIDQPEAPYSYENVDGGIKIIGYNGSDSVLAIPSTIDGKSVVAIGTSAFGNSDFLTEVIIPDSVTTLGDGMVQYCDNLVKLTLGKGVTQVPDFMADSCSKLKEVIFNGPIVSIGESAFYQCSQLQISKFPETLETIENGAFFRCNTLTSLTIPNKTTTIGSSAFVYCEKLENLTLGNSLTTLNSGAFADCISLKEVTLPKSITTISDAKVFARCSSLSKVVIPDTTTSISSNIFDKSPLTTIYGSKGSYAQSFAAMYNIPFVANETHFEVNTLYQTHVENDGWQDWRRNGAMSGTSARSLRLEGIRIKLEQQGYDLGVDYATHVQNYGWQDWKTNGDMSGTSQQALRLEAIRIKLTGADAEKFDIYYRVHAQNVGWMGWAKNGADAGTAGLSYRLEGIEIQVLPKNSPAPGTTVNPFIQK